jgi:hypothetical protein
LVNNAWSAKASELRKNEPHPMGFLATFGKLMNDLLVDLILSVQKANEIIGGQSVFLTQHGHAAFPRSFLAKGIP